ncbi:hypothetical protein KAU11_10030 [Candidatus Babeliales bacterium]|nr:hypothetical protein [Candidatus Babeliales bacterium]
MAFDLGGIGAGALGMLSSTLTWAIGLIIFILIVIAGAKIKQMKKFRYPVLEIIGLGQGKVSIQMTKGGWFKKNRSFFGLIEGSGEEELITKQGKRKIHNISSTDYHELNGRRCIIAKRKDDDPEVLVPLSKVEVKNLSLLASIAPADYRDAGIQILEAKKRETMSWMEKNSPMLIAMGVFIFGLIALIIVFNFAKGESAAWRTFAESSKTAGTIIMNSTAP